MRRSLVTSLLFLGIAVGIPGLAHAAPPAELSARLERMRTHFPAAHRRLVEVNDGADEIEEDADAFRTARPQAAVSLAADAAVEPEADEAIRSAQEEGLPELPAVATDATTDESRPGRRRMRGRLPLDDTGSFAFDLPDGLEITVSEPGIAGQGHGLGRAVAYQHQQGLALWRSHRWGYKEWIYRAPSAMNADQ